jgi:hypothetical protein
MTVASQEYAKIIKPAHDTLQLDAVNEEDRQGRLILAHVIQKCVLQVLGFFCRHVSFPFFYLSVFAEARLTPSRFELQRSADAESSKAIGGTPSNEINLQTLPPGTMRQHSH